MGLKLTLEQRRELEEDLSAAEPYDEDDPILDWYDNDDDVDFARLMATIAKKILEENPE